MQQHQTPPPRRQKTDPIEALRAVYYETKGARSAAQKLEPLLSLLETPEGGEESPIQQLQDILETIVLGQRQLHLSLEDLHAKLDSLASKRPVSNSR
jgi:hypothetical protein